MVRDDTDQQNVSGYPPMALHSLDDVVREAHALQAAMEAASRGSAGGGRGGSGSGGAGGAGVVGDSAILRSLGLEGGGGLGLDRGYFSTRVLPGGRGSVGAVTGGEGSTQHTSVWQGAGDDDAEVEPSSHVVEALPFLAGACVCVCVCVCVCCQDQCLMPQYGHC